MRCVSATLQMVLTAITNAEVAGKEARELSDDDVLTVLTSETKHSRGSHHITNGGRAEMAAKEQSEGEIMASTCQPRWRHQEIAELVTAAIAQTRRSRGGRHAGNGAGDRRSSRHRSRARPTAGLSLPRGPSTVGVNPTSNRQFSRGPRSCPAVARLPLPYRTWEPDPVDG